MPSITIEVNDPITKMVISKSSGCDTVSIDYRKPYNNPDARMKLMRELSDLAQLWKSTPGTPRRADLNRLVTIGRKAAKAIFGNKWNEVGEYFCSSPIGDIQVKGVSSTWQIPWELLYFRDTSDPSAFLGYGRNIYRDYKSHFYGTSLSVLGLISCNLSADHQDEARHISTVEHHLVRYERFPTKNGFLTREDKPSSSDLFRWLSGKDLIHFAGVMIPLQQLEQAWLMIDRSFHLSVDELRESGESSGSNRFDREPLVVLNFRDNYSRDPQQVLDYVRFFLTSAAGGVIVSELPLPSPLTVRFAEHFYTNLLKGSRSLGEVLAETKSNLINKGDLFAMFYAPFFDPRTKLGLPERGPTLMRPIPKNQNAPIVIVTTTKVETQAVLEIIGNNRKETRITKGMPPYYKLSPLSETPVYLVQSEMGSGTPGGSLSTVSQAIREWNPQAVIMCGIAFGLRPNSQKLGDILISKHIRCYEPQKIDVNQGVIPRGDRVTCSIELLRKFRAGDNDWKGASTHFGLILSGEKLVNDSSFREQLLQIEPEAIGGEMEGAGLYTAAYEAKVDWILVKAICDWADGNKNDTAQILAARNAAEFVLHVLRLGGWDSLTSRLGSPVTTEVMKGNEGESVAHETYVDFTLHIGLDGRARAESDEGERGATISLDIPTEVALVVKRIEQGETAAGLLKTFGKRLYEIIFPEAIDMHLNQTEAVARSQKRKLRIRLKIEPETLAQLPWEFLYRAERGHFLAINPDTVLSHYLDLSLPPGYVRRRSGPLHLLAIIADPTDQTRLPPDEWEAIIKTALAEPINSGQMTLEIVKRATRKEIRNALLRQKPDIIQFVGHGIYQDGTGYLALVNEKTGKTWLVDDERFANLYLGHSDHLGLISLATCESAKSDNPQGFLGIAPKLVERGVPAVLAMRYQVRIDTAKVFLEDFYSAIAARKPVDWATQSARNAITQEFGSDNREFATPVLFMRAKDGNIF